VLSCAAVPLDQVTETKAKARASTRKRDENMASGARRFHHEFGCVRHSVIILRNIHGFRQSVLFHAFDVELVYVHIVDHDLQFRFERGLGNDVVDGRFRDFRLILGA